MKGYAAQLNLTPERTLQLWESYSEGDVFNMINRNRCAGGHITHQKVNKLYERMVLRYGDTNRVVPDLKAMVHKLQPI